MEFRDWNSPSRRSPYLQVVASLAAVGLALIIVVTGHLAPRFSPAHIADIDRPTSTLVSGVDSDNGFVPSNRWATYRDQGLGFQFDYPIQYGSVLKTTRSGCWDKEHPNQADLQCQKISFFFSGRAKQSPSLPFLKIFGKEVEKNPAAGWPDVIFHIRGSEDVIRICDNLDVLLDDRADLLQPHCQTSMTEKGIPVAIYWQDVESMNFDSEERYLYTYFPAVRMLGGMAWTTEGLLENISADERSRVIMKILDSLKSI